MKIAPFALHASAVAVLMVAVLSASTVAQAPQAPAPAGAPGAPRAPRVFPAPTNLKVLPKDMTGAQVRDVMRNWEGALGADCETCHTPDPTKIGPNGKPQLNFADDSKKEKEMARLMYTMTEDLKKGPISKVASMDDMSKKAAPLTCGTCHRGKEDPEEFIIPKDDRQGPPAGMPAGMAMPKAN